MHPYGVTSRRKTFRADEHFGLRRIGVRGAPKRGQSSCVSVPGIGGRLWSAGTSGTSPDVTHDSVNAFCDLVNARGREVRDSPTRSSPLSGVADMDDGQRPAARRAGAHKITVARPIVYLKACPQRLADGTKDHDTCHCVRPRLAFVRCATLSRYVKYARDHANG